MDALYMVIISVLSCVLLYLIITLIVELAKPKKHRTKKAKPTTKSQDFGSSEDLHIGDI